MEYGQIIKKAWQIAWRYRFLWVLGIFAGVTGGSGSGFNPGSSWNRGSSGSGSSPFTNMTPGRAEALAAQWLPVIVAATLVFVAIAIIFIVIGIAARGGLIWAVNEIEDGRRPLLRDAWSQGFARFWSLLGAGILIALPGVVFAMIMGILIAVPVATAIAAGNRGAAMAVVPICGSLIIGIPLGILLWFVLGIMGVIAQRRIVLDNIGAVQAVKDAWRTFRARLKDTSLMWLINWGLNIAGGIVLAIPIVILTLIMLVPAILSGMSGNWGVFGGVIVFFTLIVVALSVFYAGVWGTFTSALWTIMYRRMTGREIVVPTPPRGPAPYPYPGVPATAPGYPAPTPPSGYVAPPVAGWPAPPSTPQQPAPEPPSPAPAPAPEPAPAPAPEAPAPAPDAPPQPPHE